MTSTVRGRVVLTGAAAPPRRDAVVEVSGGRVTAVRDAAPGDRGPVYDLLLPGLIDAHSHARYVPLARHGAGDGPLERFLIELRALTALPPADEALAAGTAALAAGITSVQVLHHSFAAAPGYAGGARDLAAGLAAAGLRGFIALGLTDTSEFAPGCGPALAPAGLSPERGLSPAAFAGLAAGLLGEPGLADGLGLVSIDAAGPVAPQWCSDSALRAISQLAAPRVHAHLLESARQRIAPGGDPVARLARAGLLTPATSLAHAVWLDDRQIGQLAAAGAVVVHCPGSNQRLAGGTCPVRRLLDAGVAVALGLDSHGAAAEPDPFAEMRLAQEVAARAGQPLTGAEVLALATAGGSRALRRADLGTLRPGAAADIVALELPGAVTAADPVGYLVAAATPAHVAATWVAGHLARPGDAAAAGAAAAARARLTAAMAADAGARAARLADADRWWQLADAAWRELETTRTAGA